jgi:hypothetical protein
MRVSVTVEFKCQRTPLMIQLPHSLLWFWTLSRFKNIPFYSTSKKYFPSKPSQLSFAIFPWNAYKFSPRNLQWKLNVNTYMGSQINRFETQLQGTMFLKLLWEDRNEVHVHLLFAGHPPCIPGPDRYKKGKGFPCACAMWGRVVSPLAVGCLHYSNRWN